MNLNKKQKLFDCEIIEHFLILSEHGSVTKEFNKVSYGGNRPKYDIRNWQSGEDETGRTYKKPLKGITLTADEMQALKMCLQSVTLETDPEEPKKKYYYRKPAEPHEDAADRIDHGFTDSITLTDEDLIL